MLVNDYVLPYFYKVDGNLILDKNSGYSLDDGSMLLPFSELRLGYTLKNSAMVVTLLDKDNLRVIGFYGNNYILNYILIYKDNTICLLYDCLDDFRRYNSSKRRQETVTFLTKVLNFGICDRELLDCILNILGLKVYAEDSKYLVLYTNLKNNINILYVYNKSENKIIYYNFNSRVTLDFCNIKLSVLLDIDNRYFTLMVIKSKSIEFNIIQSTMNKDEILKSNFGGIRYRLNNNILRIYDNKELVYTYNLEGIERIK